MKKNVVFCLICFCALSIIACTSKQNKNSNNETSAANFKSKNTDSFNLAFDSVLGEYDQLKTAFINWDTVAANRAAAGIAHEIIYVPYEQIKDEDQATKATGIAQNASSVAENLIKQNSLNDKRRMFYTLSESIYNLAQTVNYDKAILYHKKCPMAFNGEQEGWWFSASKKIDNPYFGKFHPKYKNAMLECGTVEDSLDKMH